MKNTSNVFEYKLTLHFKTSFFDKFSDQIRSFLLFAIVSILSVSSASALANYQYTYTGNPFTVTTTLYNTGELPPYDSRTTTGEENVSVIFYSPVMLSTSTIIGKELSFIISSSSDRLDNSLPYPYPNQVEPGAGLGSPTNPYYIGTFDILSVNSLGMPTDWNISVYFSYNPFRNFSTFLKTTTSQDSVFGATEGSYEFSGELNNNSGQWRISVVPELETYAYMLSGLVLIGLVGRLKNTQV